MEEWGMTMNELERKIAQLRSQPLQLLCRTPKGREKVMTPEECRRTGSTYLHVVSDDLDLLLAVELNRAE